MVQNISSQFTQSLTTTNNSITDSLNTSSESQNAATAAAADFESFLQLLTAQISNQDPLSPLDSTQFVEQLASFTGVEQQIGTNTRLDSLLDNLSSSSLGSNSSSIGSLSELIGEYVSTPSTRAVFNDEPIAFFVETASIPTTATLQITNSSGQTVQTLPIVDSGIIVWNGETTNGPASPNEAYSLNIVNTDNEGNDQIVGFGTTLARVTQIHLDGTEPALRLNNNEIISLDMVSGLFDAESIRL